MPETYVPTAAFYGIVLAVCCYIAIALLGILTVARFLGLI